MKKYLTARIDEELHKKLKIKLIKDNLTFQKWVEMKIIEYVNKMEDNNE